MSVANSISQSKKTTKKQGRGRSNSLQPHVVEYLKKWLMSEEHINHPYPSETEKARIVADTGIDIKRLNNWFVNNRIRYWKPRMEALQKEKNKNEQSCSSIDLIPLPIRNEKILVLSLLEGAACTNTDTSTDIGNGSEEEGTNNTLRVVSPRPNLGLSDLFQTVINDVSAAIIDDDNCSSSVTGEGDSEDVENFDLMTFQFRRRKRRRTEIRNDFFNTTGLAITNLSTCTHETPRYKYLRKNVEQWKLACLESPKPDDKNLPTLDEAVHLFGYSIRTA